MEAVITANQYAGFLIRLLAYFIDSTIVVIFLAIFGMMLFPSYGMVFLLSMPLAFWLYEALMTSSIRQATFGKMIFNLRITDMKGSKISFGRASVRHFSKYISHAIAYIGFIMIAFDDKRQGLHDLLAKTFVVKTH